MPKSRMPEPIVLEIGQTLRDSRRLLIVSHLRPDGDAVGSLLGLGLSLQAAGKTVQMVLDDGVPASFRHLPGADQVRKSPEGAFDCIVVVDCSDLARTGEALRGLGMPQINIDHHPTNDHFAALNLVVDSACATAEVLHDLLTAIDLPIGTDAAAALLTGLITDTLGFQTPNIRPQALRTAAALMDRGLDLSALYRKGLVEKSFEALRYWGAGLNSLQREADLVWATLRLEDRKACGYPGRDDADLVGQLSTIRDSNVRIVFVEQSPREVKVSWRSQPGYDVSELARGFGGGGHRTAAGANISGGLGEVQARVLEVTREMMRQARQA